MKKNKKKFLKLKLRLEHINRQLDFVKSFKKLVPQLKQSGSSYRCKSPFNPSEKTPSFFVNPDKHLWKCFSTGNGGADIVSYVMKKDGLNFREGLEYIEHMFGLKSKYATKSILKSLIKNLNEIDKQEHESGDSLIKRAYENKLIKFLDRFKATAKGCRFGYWKVREYIFDEFDITTFRTPTDFDKFVKNAYGILVMFRPKPYPTLARFKVKKRRRCKCGNHAPPI